MNRNTKVIVIGGSAGSFEVVSNILKALPKDYKMPIIMCLHRLKHVREGFVEALELKSNLPIVEPYDKEKIKPGKVYLAPSNYHMCVELNGIISLSTEEMVNFSRPAIDLTLASAGYVYTKRVIGIILSGANRDGALGIKKIKKYKGTTIIQDRKECKVTTMPDAAKKATEIDYELTTNQIIEFLLKLNN